MPPHPQREGRAGRSPEQQHREQSGTHERGGVLLQHAALTGADRRYDHDDGQARRGEQGQGHSLETRERPAIEQQGWLTV